MKIFAKFKKVIIFTLVFVGVACAEKWDETFPAVFNLENLNGKNGFVINGIKTGNQSGFAISGVGDINGDGIDDIIIGAYAANRGTGQSYVVFGSRKPWTTSINLVDLNGDNGFVIDGVLYINHDIGYSVSGVGDVNGDGIDDILIGSPGSNDGVTGQTYVIFGSKLKWPKILNIKNLNGNNGFTINGFYLGQQSGKSVSGVGDVNGDGINDVLIGCYDINIVGQSYVIFGDQKGWPAVIDLFNINGLNGFIINGVKQDLDARPSVVAHAGDVNGDGIDDVLIGGPGANNQIGQNYIVFGSKQQWPKTISLTSLNGTNGFTMNGINQGDDCGYSLNGIGDVNNDGIDDIIIGAPFANNRIGQSYVVFGSRQRWPKVIDFFSFNATRGFTINGINEDDSSGMSVAGAGDVNNDGIDDILIGVPLAQNGAGQACILFGTNRTWPAVINLSELDGFNGFTVNGIDWGDQIGRSLAGRVDINGDSVDDILIGAPYADSYTGKIYVIFGE